MKAIAASILASFALFASACAAADKPTAASALEFKMKGLDGKDVDLSTYKGKVVLFVNVASECGYTPQYEGLQELYRKYEKAGLVVIGVPTNEFGEQEPGSDAEIAKFCATNYKVTFPMLSKVKIKGSDAVPLYKYLVANSSDTKDVGWNFEKFLVDRNGKVVGRFKSAVDPTAEELVKAIQVELEKK